MKCVIFASFSAYLDNGSESLVMPIIRRHETLSITHQELLQRLGHLEEEVEQGQRLLRTMKQEHSIKKLVRHSHNTLQLVFNRQRRPTRVFLYVLQMANKELSELQSELETLKEKNKQAEVNLIMEQGLSREKVYL